MKRLILILLICSLLLPGCGSSQPGADIAATTLPVYEFTQRLTGGTGLTVTRLVNESVSCLHDYSLNVDQVRAAESADLIVISGAGLEDFMEDLLQGKQVIDSSAGLELLECAESHDHDGHHHHEEDSHIWLSPAYAKHMARNICAGLAEAYPQHSGLFQENLDTLLADLDALEAYGNTQLSGLEERHLITFHDGFGYFADSFNLHILKAVEEESGSEASAGELKELIALVREHHLPAIFTETNGSGSAATVISRETGAGVFTLDMAMAGDSYFSAMYHNIDVIKEALG